MLWFALALTGALCQAAYGLSVKLLLRRIPPFVLAGLSFLAGSAMLFCLSFLAGVPPLGTGLPAAIAVTVVINVLATILFYRALAVSDLSLCVPLLAFTPVFLIFTSFIILGEVPTPAGAAGILLVAAGAWLLALEYRVGRRVSLSGPLRTLRSDRGVQEMLVVAFLYSISVNYDKEVVENSDPLFGGAVVLLLIGLAFVVLAVIFRRGREEQFRRLEVRPGPENSSCLAVPPEPGAVLPGRNGRVGTPSPLVYPVLGLLLTVEVIAINTAYTLAIVPYVITVKRLSIFFSVLFGGLLLAETHFRGRVLGAAVMIAGAVVIGLWG